MKRTILLLTVGLAVFFSACPGLCGQTESDASKKYHSKYKNRGDVHGIVSALPYPVVYAEVTRAFTSLDLTINYEEPALGYIQGGRSRGVSGEVIRIWIDPEDKNQFRIEVTNERISRMGLIGFAGTKDWSKELLAAITKQLGDRPSIAQLKAAVESKPESIEGRRQLIDAYVVAGMLDEATESYRALLARSPGSQLDRTKFADLLSSRGQTDQAIGVLKEAEGSDPDVAMTLARIYLETEQSAKAVEILTTLVHNNPGDLKARYNLARAAYFAGDLPTAKTGFSGIIEQSPQHPFAEQSRLWLKVLEAGELKKPLDAKAALAVGALLTKENLDLLAQRYLESALDSSSGAERDQIMRQLATIYQSRRQFAAIIKLLTPHVDRFGKEKQGELIYALVLAHCGQREFQLALANFKLAKKAGYKPPKDFEQVLKSYQ